MKNLIDQIKSLDETHSKQKMELVSQLNQLIHRKLKTCDQIQKDLVSVQDSKELTQTDDEWFSQFHRVDLSKYPIDLSNEYEVDVLIEYLGDQGASLDKINECLMHSIGPCILINDEGDVLDQDSGKWFIAKNDYENELELNALIEKYMEKTEYFPSVVSCDRYGNVFYVNTQKGEKK